MIKFSFIVIILTQALAFAGELKIMNFNTMCDFCHGSDFFEYDSRLKEISRIIKTHDPDLISLQEIRSVSQVKELLKELPAYDYIATEHLLISYADPTILFRKEKFKLLSHDNLWLGPNQGSFSLGWKSALPRQLLKAKFEFEGKVFHFLSSHFDNIRSNLEGSVQLLQDQLKQMAGPVIFAADTNIALDMKLYKKLMLNFIDSFDIKEKFEVQGNYQDDKDLCYLRKGEVFPICRVEHILLNDKYQWKVTSFLVDATKNKSGKFPSDHRAFVITLDLPKDAPQSSSSNSLSK